MYIFGNWKMYLDNQESVDFAKNLAKEDTKYENIELAVFPSSLSMIGVEEQLRGSAFSVGAQNCTWTPKGAYTGAISALMFKDVGCKYALVGHSERRHIFGETNQDVRKKIEAVLDAGLIPVLCIGETIEDRENGKTEYRLKKQLNKALENLNVAADKIIIAYEPVWAIGTGNPCDPADADAMHRLVKKEIGQYIEGEVPVLYGGSVKADNVVSYLSLEAVNGVLIGGASVKADSFLDIINAVKSIN